MRVLTVGNLYPPAAEGGYERTWRAVVVGLRTEGHVVRVLTTAPVAGRELPPGHVDPPEVVRALRWYWRDFAFVRGGFGLERHNAAVLRAELADFAPDAVCWFGMGGMSLSLLESVRRVGLPSVAVVEDDWLRYGRRADRWTRGWRGRGPETVRGVPTRVDLPGAADYRFASEWLRARAAPLGLARTSVVPLGVHPAAFPPQPAREWGWRLACVGRVEPGKGLENAVGALTELPDAELTIRGAGDAAHLTNLRTLAAHFGVRSRTRFEPAATGPVVDAYAAADAVLFPVTWEEPFGLVPLEAMSVGRPVVATGTGGSAEYLRDGVNALVVPRGVPPLAGAVRRLAGDAALRERLIAGGRETAARYTEARFVDSVITALAASTTNSGSSGAR